MTDTTKITDRDLDDILGLIEIQREQIKLLHRRVLIQEKYMKIVREKVFIELEPLVEVDDDRT